MSNFTATASEFFLIFNNHSALSLFHISSLLPFSLSTALFRATSFPSFPFSVSLVQWTQRLFKIQDEPVMQRKESFFPPLPSFVPNVNFCAWGLTQDREGLEEVAPRMSVSKTFRMVLCHHRPLQRSTLL